MARANKRLHPTSTNIRRALHNRTVPCVDRPDLFKNCPQWKANNRPSGRPSWERLERSLGRASTKIAEQSADERCSQAILHFIATTDVGRTAGPTVSEDGRAAASGASEWDNARNSARSFRQEEKRLGVEEEANFYSFFIHFLSCLPYFLISFVSSLHRIRFGG